MKRIAIPVETDQLCHYGCGCVAKFKNGSGNLMCLPSSNSCPANKKKNSDKIKIAHSEGRIPSEFGGKRYSTKGLTKDTTASIARPTLKGVPRVGGFRPHTEESKMKMRESRNKIILEGRYDSSGRKGHRGHFEGLYFHSSWELAFYLWNRDNGILVRRNTQKIFTYMSGGKEFSYIPDFEIGDRFIEIKAYLHSKRDIDKYEQSKDFVEYLFKKEMTHMIQYCKDVYGKTFWDLYDENSSRK